MIFAALTIEQDFFLYHYWKKKMELPELQYILNDTTRDISNQLE
jgi:hypothetical protein